MPPRTTLTHAAWQRGHQLTVEYPDRLVAVHRAGFYTRLEGVPGTGNQVHFAVPTPVLTAGGRSVVGHVMLCYRSHGGAVVDAVHVYDGERRIAGHDGVNRRPETWAYDRFAVPGSPTLRGRLGIRVTVRFPDGGGIDFASAGCDFLPRGRVRHAPAVTAASH